MILASAFRSEQTSAPSSPFDDRWYLPELGVQAFGSTYFTPETMMRCSTVLAALRFLGTSVGLCRPQIVQYDGDARKRRPDHYAQRALRKPHPRFTDFEWWELNTVWHSSWGNSYNRIIPGTDSPIGRLQPLPPWQMKVVDQDREGGLIYRYTPAAGQGETLTEGDLLRFPGIGTDGVEGVRMYQLVRNVVMIALLAERHTSMFLAKGARIGGMLVPKSPLDKEQRDELVSSWNLAVGGPDKTGVIAALPYGVDFQAFTQSNKDSQLLELTDSVIGHILRFFNVPGVVVGWNDKSSTYASAEAFFEKGGIKHCILPLITRLERRVDHSLIFEDNVFCKMNLDVLLRADTEKRFAALFRATGRPWMTGNEARSIEDMNRMDDDESMDRVAMPTNLTTQDLEADSSGSTKPPRPSRDARIEIPPVDASDAARETQVERGRRLAVLAAARLVRRELAAVKDRVSLAARDEAAWTSWVDSYYSRHAVTVAREMDIDAEIARAYAEGQRADLLAEGISVTATWEQTVIPKLARLAFGD